MFVLPFVSCKFDEANLPQAYARLQIPSRQIHQITPLNHTTLAPSPFVFHIIAPVPLVLQIRISQAPYCEYRDPLSRIAESALLLSECSERA